MSGRGSSCRSTKCCKRRSPSARAQKRPPSGDGGRPRSSPTSCGGSTPHSNPTRFSSALPTARRSWPGATWRASCCGERGPGGVRRGTAPAILTAQFFRGATPRRRAVESLAEVGRRLSQSLDPCHVAQRIAESVRGLLGAPVAVVYRLEPATEQLVAIGLFGSVGPTFGENL